MFSRDVERALRAALSAHEGQLRKGGAVPYVSHPIHAALILARAGASDVALQAALLHDVVEDCEEWTLARVEEEFGREVSHIVGELTEDKGRPWEERKRWAVEHVPHMRPEAMLVKAADKLHNLSTLLHDLEAADDPGEVWRHFRRDAETTLRSSQELVTALVPRLPPELADALTRVLDDLLQRAPR